jgi:hypothetical protein
VRTSSSEYWKRPGATRRSVGMTLVRVALAGNIAGATGADLVADGPGDEDEQRLTDHDVLFLCTQAEVPSASARPAGTLIAHGV